MQHAQAGSEAYLVSYSINSSVLSSGIKRLERESDHCPLHVFIACIETALVMLQCFFSYCNDNFFTALSINVVSTQ